MDQYPCLHSREFELSLSMLELARAPVPSVVGISRESHHCYDRAAVNIAPASSVLCFRESDNNENSRQPSGEEDQSSSLSTSKKRKLDLTIKPSVKARRGSDRSEGKPHQPKIESDVSVLKLTEAPPPPPDRRRKERNMREQERAQKIAYKIAELGEILPDSFQPKKADKGSILDSAKAFILHLLNENKKDGEVVTEAGSSKASDDDKNSIDEGHEEVSVGHDSPRSSGGTSRGEDSNLDDQRYLLSKPFLPIGCPTDSSVSTGEPSSASQGPCKDASTPDILLSLMKSARPPISSTGKSQHAITLLQALLAPAVSSPPWHDSQESTLPFRPSWPQPVSERPLLEQIGYFPLVCSVTVNLKGYFLDCNGAFEELVGCRRSALVLPGTGSLADQRGEGIERLLTSSAHSTPLASTNTIGQSPREKPSPEFSLFHVLHPDERMKVLLHMVALFEDTLKHQNQPQEQLPPVGGGGRMWNGLVTLMTVDGRQVGRMRMVVGLVQTQAGQAHSFHCLLNPVAPTKADQNKME